MVQSGAFPEQQDYTEGTIRYLICSKRLFLLITQRENLTILFQKQCLVCRLQELQGKVDTEGPHAALLTKPEYIFGDLHIADLAGKGGTRGSVDYKTAYI